MERGRPKKTHTLAVLEWGKSESVLGKCLADPHALYPRIRYYLYLIFMDMHFSQVSTNHSIVVYLNPEKLFASVS